MEVQKISHVLLVIAFISKNDVKLCLNILFLSDDMPKELFSIVDYLKEFYVTRRHERGRRKAYLPPRYRVSMCDTEKAIIYVSANFYPEISNFVNFLKPVKRTSRKLMTILLC